MTTVKCHGYEIKWNDEHKEVIIPYTYDSYGNKIELGRFIFEEYDTVVF
ncbi:MAG: hypothetical protein PHC28_07865 [Flavobacterium sp.]|nr:hypothetical protein [Flavobacterium sp.]